MFDLGIAIGFDKHERGAFRVNTKGSGLGDWYGASGLALTTQFFGMKINRYMHEHGISQSTLAKVVGEGVPQRVEEPDGLAAQAAVGGRGARVADALVPADAVHVLLARARAAWR